MADDRNDFEIENGILKKYRGNETVVTVPNGVTGIGAKAFSLCMGIKKIILPQSICSIGACAFEWCQSLEEINLPDNLLVLEEGLFYHCFHLKSLSMPSMLTEVKKAAIQDCYDLQTIIISDLDSWCKITFKDRPPNRFSLIIGNELLTDLVIPDGITEIKAKAFQNIKDLRTVFLPEGLKKIGVEAFCYCENLKHINLPMGLREIGSRAFLNCKSLGTISFPPSLRQIGAFAFYHCISLSTNIIPSSISGIDKNTFGGCIKISNSNFPQPVREAIFESLKEEANTLFPRLPYYGFDPDGVKKYRVNDSLYEVHITDKLQCELYDVKSAKTIRAFPKNTTPSFLDTVSDYNTIKKEIPKQLKLYKEQLVQLYVSGAIIPFEKWKKRFLDHPIMIHLAKRLVWMDTSYNTFIIYNNELVDSCLRKYIPKGDVAIAHVMDINSSEITEWKKIIITIPYLPLFEQLGEPIIEWNNDLLKTKYKGIVITSNERYELKALMKEKGISLRSGQFEMTDPWKYAMITNNTFYFDDVLEMDYGINPTTKELSFDSVRIGNHPVARKINTILIEMELLSTKKRIQKDDVSFFDYLSVFNISQITEFITIAQEAKANNALALLLDYKNTHFPNAYVTNDYSLE